MPELEEATKLFDACQRAREEVARFERGLHSLAGAGSIGDNHRINNMLREGALGRLLPEGVGVNIGTINDQSKKSPKDSDWLKLALAAIGGALIVGLIVLICMLWTPRQAVSPVPAKAQDFDIKWEVIDGKMHIKEVKPIP